MAKDKGKEDGSKDYEFIPPDFDEDAFIHKEMVSFRTTIVLFVWGVIAALVSWAVFNAMDGASLAWRIGLVIAAIMGYALRWLYPLLKIDIKHFARKDWLGTGFLFFFTWLAFFIVLVNPPISDYADPAAIVYVSPDVQQAGAETSIHLFAFDNAGIEDTDFVLRRGTTVIADDADLTPRDGGFTYTAKLSAGTYQYTWSATDNDGRTATTTGWANVTSKAITYFPPANDRLAGPQDRLAVSVPSGMDIRTVYLDLGERVAHLQHDDVTDTWFAAGNFAGLTQGENTFTVVAEQHHRWQGPHKVPGGNITRGPFTVSVDFEPVTIHQPDVPPARNDAPVVSTPGLAPVALLGLLGGAVALKRKE